MKTLSLRIYASHDVLQSVTTLCSAQPASLKIQPAALQRIRRLPFDLQWWPWVQLLQLTQNCQNSQASIAMLLGMTWRCRMTSHNTARQKSCHFTIVFYSAFQKILLDFWRKSGMETRPLWRCQRKRGSEGALTGDTGGNRGCGVWRRGVSGWNFRVIKY